MAEMSPLARVLLDILRKGSMGAAALLVLFAGILLYQRKTPSGFVFQQGDMGFFLLLGLLFCAALYLVRGIARELHNPRG